MREHLALMRILHEYIGVNINDLTRLEQNIMDYACQGTGMLMPNNSAAEFTGPTSPELD